MNSNWSYRATLTIIIIKSHCFNWSIMYLHLQSNWSDWLVNQVPGWLQWPNFHTFFFVWISRNTIVEYLRNAKVWHRAFDNSSCQARALSYSWGLFWGRPANQSSSLTNPAGQCKQFKPAADWRNLPCPFFWGRTFVSSSCFDQTAQSKRCKMAGQSYNILYFLCTVFCIYHVFVLLMKDSPITLALCFFKFWCIFHFYWTQALAKKSLKDAREDVFAPQWSYLLKSQRIILYVIFIDLSLLEW